MKRLLLILALCLALPAPTLADPAVTGVQPARGGRVTIVVRDTPIAEVYEMLAKQERINILLGDGVEGEVSLNLYEMSVDRAIRAIAEAAGYVAERRRGSYLVLEREEAGKESANGNTVVRALEVHYSDPQKVGDILDKHLSRYGELSVFDDRRMIVVEDLPDFVRRIEDILSEIDQEPAQVLIEAKILEITLDDDQTFGINWTQLLQDGEAGDVGVQGLAALGTPGFFFDFVKAENLTVALNALSDEGRVRTLSTPTLVAIEDQESEVIIGDRLGFRVTTTINQITTESVEFLESGVILRFLASVDRLGRVYLDVHPEVSTGTIDDGLPNQTTAEVSTRLIIEDGQTVFIGGLIKDRASQSHTGAPFLKKIPILGWAFSSRENLTITTETIVIVDAHVLRGGASPLGAERRERLEREEDRLEEERLNIERSFEPASKAPTSSPASSPGSEAPASRDSAVEPNQGTE